MKDLSSHLDARHVAPAAAEIPSETMPSADLLPLAAEEATSVFEPRRKSIDELRRESGVSRRLPRGSLTGPENPNVLAFLVFVIDYCKLVVFIRYSLRMMTTDRNQP